MGAIKNKIIQVMEEKGLTNDEAINYLSGGAYCELCFRPVAKETAQTHCAQLCGVCSEQVDRMEEDQAYFDMIRTHGCCRGNCDY